MALRSFAFLLLMAAPILACEPDIDGTSLTNGKSKTGGAGVESSSDPTLPDGPESAFDYGAQVALLPFDVRLEKVARVAGVTSAHAILEAARSRRLELGDADYANNVKPDLSWTPNRIGIWVKVMRSVCASKEVHARYPTLPGELGDLFVAAYGREPTDEDVAAIQEGLGSALDSESAYQMTCLSVLTSLEFVAR